LAGRYAASIFPIAVLVVSPFVRVLLGHQKNATLHRFGTGLNFDFLMYGCIIALLQHRPRFESIYRTATRFWWPVPTLIAACSVASMRYQNYFDLPVGYTIVGAAIAIALLWCIRNPSSMVGRILNWRPIAAIGVLSYSIYIWQTLFLHHLNFTVFGRFTWISTFPGNWLGFFL
jgi:peptidoglycan/LPS O-acetylase OafA/YrhL